MARPRTARSRTAEAAATKARRVLALYRYLLDSRRARTVAEILEDVYEDSGDRGRRRFYRDLETLRQAGVPVEASRARYRLAAATAVVRGEWKERHLFALAMARNLARAHLGPQTAAAFDEIVAGVRSAVPEELSAFSDYCQAFFLTRPPIGKAAEPNETYLQNIARALAENRKLEIHYRPSEDRREDVHVVHPYFVPFVDGVPYVVGHSEQRGETRVFAMDRIRDLRVLDATFERPEEFRVEQLDPDEIWERSFKAFFRHGEPEGRTLVIIEFEPPMANIIRSRQWHPSQRIQRSANGHVTLSMMCAVTPDLKAWILSFGRHARVVEPRELAREIRAEHAAAARAR